MTPAGSATARATTSRIDLWVRSALNALRQSSTKRSRSNMAPSLIAQVTPDGDCFASLAMAAKGCHCEERSDEAIPSPGALLRRRVSHRCGLRAVALLVEIIGAVKVEHEVTID